ncbi:MAG: hypothetical protein IIA67_08525 [Planctomycetes bacterium]|nr:hypothetical protein [Planctomycetota bacterium]
MSVHSLAACLSGVILVVVAGPSVAQQPNAKQHFDNRIAPLIARRCLSCHSGPKPKGELDLSSRKTALAGGESGLSGEPKGGQHGGCAEALAEAPAGELFHLSIGRHWPEKNLAKASISASEKPLAMRPIIVDSRAPDLKAVSFSTM